MTSNNSNFFFIKIILDSFIKMIKTFILFKKIAKILIDGYMYMIN